MPTIVATPFPAEGYVRLDIDWRDTTLSSTTHVVVTRTNVSTGEQVTIRPYVAYNSSGCQMLNCLQSTMWDTDPPLNVPLLYTVANCTPTAFFNEQSPTFWDTFSRASAATWSASDSGDAYTWTGGVATRSINGSEGVIDPTPSDSGRNVTLATGLGGNGYLTGRARIDFQPTGGDMEISLFGRYTGTTNYYQFLLRILSTGALETRIVKVVAGVPTILDTDTLIYTHVAGATYNLKAQLQGSTLTMTAWPTTEPEPGSFSSFANDTDFGPLTLMNPGIGAAAGTVSTTSNPVYFSQFTAYEYGATPTAVSSAQVTVTTESLFLKNPLHPCLDVELITCGSANVWTCEDPDARQIVFSQMSAESFDSNVNNLLPANRRRAIPVYRERRDVEATLTLVTRTFADRDALRASLLPGSPLLLQLPPEYGIADRYMSVGTVVESRGLPDHRFQPRVVELPHVAVDRPEGPTDGVCGTRFQDLCGYYDSWDALHIAGITWQDILEGDAAPGSPGTPPVETLRTWGDVNTEFASWGAVNNGVRTWEGTLEGA